MDPTIYRGTLPLLIEGPVIRRGKKGELDTAAWKAIVHADNVDNDLASLGFLSDEQVDGLGHAMFLGDWVETPESDLVTEVALTAEGLMSSDERRRRTISFGQREISVGPMEKVILAWNDDENAVDPETGTPVKVKRRVPKVDEDTGEVIYQTIFTATGTAERWNIKEPICSVRDTYYATTAPDTSAVGGAYTPPNAPSPPAYLWGSYTGPKRANHPAGWVLDDREIDEISPNGLWRVTDTASYYQPELPD